MASKTIEQFVKQLGDKGIEVSENTVRRKLKLIQCSADDLQDTFTQAFITKMLQDGFEASVFNKLKRDNSELKESKLRITSLENEVQNLKERLESLENAQKVVSIPKQDVITPGEVVELKPWEEAFNTKSYLHLLERYRSIPETDERHIVNWIYELTDDERQDFYAWAAMDWDDPNHPRYR